MATDPSPDPSSPLSRAESLFADFVRRAEAGDKVDFEAVARSNPDLAGTLRELKSNWDAMSALRERAGLGRLPSDPAAKKPRAKPAAAADPAASPGRAAPNSDSEPSSLLFARKARRQDESSQIFEAAPGRRIGPFLLTKKLGSGGMGQVWEAEQTDLGRRVALKLLRADKISERSTDYFLREGKAAARLSHAHLVAVYESGVTDEIHWISMELVPGGVTLADFIVDMHSSEELPSDYYQKVAQLVAQVADALQSAHEAQVIHRDLKPANSLITAADRPKVGDFGLAKLTDEVSLTRTGEVLGTLAYMSPEQVSGRQLTIDHRTDIFSLGVVLYELLTFARPFTGDTQAQVKVKISFHEPIDPRAIRSRVPEELAVICHKMMEKDPAWRYRTMREVQADLNRFLANEPIEARPPSRVRKARLWVRRNPTISAVMVVGGVALLAISFLLVDNVKKRGAAVASASEALKNERDSSRKTQDLIATQILDDLIQRARRSDLSMVDPRNLPELERWVAEARRLVEGEGVAGVGQSGLKLHQERLAELTSRAAQVPEAERLAAMSSSLRRPELESKKERLAWLKAVFAHRLDPATPGPSNIRDAMEWKDYPSTPIELNERAFFMVGPKRTHFGDERVGWALVEHALELEPGWKYAKGEPHLDQAAALDTLAWALFANGRDEEATQTIVRARKLSPNNTDLEESASNLAKQIQEERGYFTKARQAKEIHDLEHDIADIEASIAPRLKFAEQGDQFWYEYLTKLGDDLQHFADPATGVWRGFSPADGPGVEWRCEQARALAERTLQGAAAQKRWQDAIASMRDRDQCPLYKGRTFEPQLGLLPLRRDAKSGLWEFWHVLSGKEPLAIGDGPYDITPEMGIVLILVPGGSFQMGSAEGQIDPADSSLPPPIEMELPVHTVEIDPFFISKYELSQGQWKQLTGANPSFFSPEKKGLPSTVTLLHPLENVSWARAMPVLSVVGLTLPTEAQWERAARAGSTQPWWTGANATSLEGVANLLDMHGHVRPDDPLLSGTVGWDDGWILHASVGSYRANPFGLHDVYGNVWEWCRDILGSYADPLVAGTGERRGFDPDSNHVVRGGSYNNSPFDCRSAARSWAVPGNFSPQIGVRPSRDLDSSNDRKLKR